MNFTIEIKNGKADLKTLRKALQFIRSLKDGWYDVKFTKHKNKRSIQQNKYYWGVVIPFVQNFFNSFKRIAPMTDKQAHVQIKDICGMFEEVQIYDKDKNTLIEKRIYASFSNAGDLSTMGFNDMCDILREAIATLSHGEFILPEPLII
jgi:hypothetical protein